jgi:hypothetical protein
MVSPRFQSPNQRRQIPRALTMPLQVEVEVVEDVEAKPLEDLDDEMVMVERVEGGAAVLLVL